MPLDKATIWHLDNWVAEQLPDDQRERAKAAMLAVAAEDPEYWLNRSWRDVLDEVKRRVE